MAFQTTKWRITSTKMAKFAWRQFGDHILTLVLPFGKQCYWRIAMPYTSIRGNEPCAVRLLHKFSGTTRTMGEAMKIVTDQIILMESVKNARNSL